METNKGAESLILDNLSIAVYKWTLTRGSVVDDHAATELGADPQAIARAQESLLELGLFTRAEENGPLVAVNPEIAESSLSAPLERDIAERRQRLTTIHRGLRALAPIYLERNSRRPNQESFRVVSQPTEVVRELTAAARNCSEEVLTMQPGGGRNADTLRAALTRDLTMLERGVSMRILYQHTARASLATRTYVRQVSDAGAEVRTTGEIVERLIVFDRKAAFIPKQNNERRAPGAIIVVEPSVVDFLCRTHENAWLSGQPFEPDHVQYEQAADTLQTSILRLMALGLKDAVIARRMGMATRTCRRYIATIMEDLGVTSRFQAGARAAQMGLLPSGDDVTGDPDEDKQPDEDTVPVTDDE
jgi:DNA-binding CsgD family transcriptional regulator